MMKEDQFEQALQRSLKALDELPGPKKKELKRLIEETRKRHDQIKVSFQEALSAIDDWRLIQKYYLFDQEARDRENKNHPETPDQNTDL